MNFDANAKQLGLTDDQKTKAQPIFDEMRQKMTDLRQDTTVQGADRRAKMKEIRDAATAKLKDILTPEQLDKWSKMGNRRPPGGAAANPPPATTN
jgi:Spy/CpxP family protein refolding chaperone